MRLATLALAAALPAFGCAEYIENRADDLADIARLNIGGGYGASVDASITRYVRFSAGGYEKTVKAGFVGRQGGIWKERRQGLAFVGGYTETSREPIRGNALLPPPDTTDRLQPWYADEERGVTEIAVSLLIFGGFELGVDPGQMLDFIVGLAGIDIYEDDFDAPVAPPGPESRYYRHRPAATRPRAKTKH
ncbi:MAG: hypothetical protein HQ592_05855 [Planctomycetes bacterium]|jgi:hypothetical protein|nr:hypothetical protein [Planctomycetota bacterium]